MGGGRNQDNTDTLCWAKSIHNFTDHRLRTVDTVDRSTVVNTFSNPPGLVLELETAEIIPTNLGNSSYPSWEHGYFSGTVMTEATATTLKFLLTSSSGQWWLTEQRFPASAETVMEWVFFHMKKHRGWKQELLGPPLRISDPDGALQQFRKNYSSFKNGISGHGMNLRLLSCSVWLFSE
uniref:Uncharacterized protein n=1 Tax=Sphaerodactylus townsendi TaxID=933632 RepID=A0ACB8GC19_9SAUR